ncbi:RNB-like protein [Dictyocaulus viviparus]|uniref:Protein DIS3 homolog n=1 Tax=Dictyocaulus viviparus TaxID=29172 RepID=A0A0D8Y353_DICVI|nr:RNB-like protein [Dictyocaulus viviparus]
MLFTMQAAYVSVARSMPNPERIDRVNETMNNIESVVHERNEAYYRLETGDGADPPLRTVTSFMGFTFKKPAEEHLEPPNECVKEYEVPYLDSDAYMMQKLWAEKEFLKERDRNIGLKMEINVKQSGIVDRLVFSTNFKFKNRCLKRTMERYLRDDLSCGLHRCEPCSTLAINTIGKKPNVKENALVPGNHAIIVDAEVLIRFIDIFGSDLFQCVFCQSVVLLQREMVLSVCAKFLALHWAESDILPIILCVDDDALSTLRLDYEFSFTIKEYVQGMHSPKKNELLDSMAAYDCSLAAGKTIYENYLSHHEIIEGIAQGTIKKGTFSVSRENYREAYVLVEPSTMTSWFIQGLCCNRAIDGDIVAVMLLPEDEWTLPEKKMRLRDVEDFEINDDDEIEENGVESFPKIKRAKLNLIPTAKVVGIIKRNWRPYCGVLRRSQLKNGRRHLFCPSNRLIPRIQIESEQADILENQRIVVCIDQWPRDSSYPLGHYVRALGKIGDREIENEVLLLENDIPHAPFSDAVLDCLPNVSWKAELQSSRVDLRHLTICSVKKCLFYVDPLGCTDIDDALHYRSLDNGILEVRYFVKIFMKDVLFTKLYVGVHIADVTHFVRSGTAIDDEAAIRGTTVYLCDRRIDMLPALLSSDLCSLKGGEERYAFSVIWTMTSNAEILSTKYHKSLICSKAALTYEKAQELIDDPTSEDDVTIGLRSLMKLSRFLKEKRMANGALTLASTEVRFEMDWDTRTLKGVQESKHLDTHSMVEEFMLLANISVAEKILSEYPDCAILRRHPEPIEASYKPLIEVYFFFTTFLFTKNDASTSRSSLLSMDLMYNCSR